MPKDQNRFVSWFHRTFDSWFFRSFIGPAQTDNAVHGADAFAREQWKRDLEARKQYTRDKRAAARR
ncbi:hypothetical protein [Actinoplanes friuliensis]|uniref:Uncharacterized protein n=1 Tax=Actinoplanes friuliensis DSM 7358 TaxID=1246995 RepID=U5W0C9_9ACTN|nr:hypothetical protein [Actinoplanes friuliensis]AGZ41386.1 hypothetical protein AFR_15520 [Actinoplanes friuliensis DSM 7358]